MIWFVFVLYIFLSALGLTLIKMGSSNVSFQLLSGIFNFKLDIKLILGMICYIVSFLLFMVMMPKFDLSYIYPVAAGALYIVIAIFAVFLLGEKISTAEWIGMIFILVGIIFMSSGK